MLQRSFILEKQLFASSFVVGLMLNSKRVCRRNTYLDGRSEFNGDVFEVEHLIVNGDVPFGEYQEHGLGKPNQKHRGQRTLVSPLQVPERLLGGAVLATHHCHAVPRCPGVSSGGASPFAQNGRGIGRTRGRWRCCRSDPNSGPNGSWRWVRSGKRGKPLTSPAKLEFDTSIRPISTVLYLAIASGRCGLVSRLAPLPGSL
jgi:hypothetical protein